MAKKSDKNYMVKGTIEFIGTPSRHGHGFRTKMNYDLYFTGAIPYNVRKILNPLNNSTTKSDLQMYDLRTAWKTSRGDGAQWKTQRTAIKHYRMWLAFLSGGSPPTDDYVGMFGKYVVFKKLTVISCPALDLTSVGNLQDFNQQIRPPRSWGIALGKRRGSYCEKCGILLKHVPYIPSTGTCAFCIMDMSKACSDMVEATFSSTHISKIKQNRLIRKIEKEIR